MLCISMLWQETAASRSPLQGAPLVVSFAPRAGDGAAVTAAAEPRGMPWEPTSACGASPLVHLDVPSPAAALGTSVLQVALQGEPTAAGSLHFTVLLHAPQARRHYFILFTGFILCFMV